MGSRLLVTIVCAIVVLSTRTAHAEDAPTYSLRNGKIAVDAPEGHDEIAVDCEETFALRAHAGNLYVACGAKGAAVYSLSDPAHPVAVGRLATDAPCIGFADDAACIRPQPPAAATVRVHINHRKGGRLMRFGDYFAARRWRNPEKMCVAPCDVRVPRDGWYVFIESGGFGERSAPFTFEQARDAVRIDVHVTSRSHVGAGVAVLLGSLAGAAGIEAMAFGARQETCSNIVCASALAPLLDILAGAVALGGTITGLVLMTASTQMTVSFSYDGEAPAHTEHRATWRPTLRASERGASFGLGVTF